MSHRTSLGVASCCLLFSACVASHHPVQRADLGVSRSSDDLLAVLPQPGPIEFETINSADWEVDRKGLINLSHPKAKAARLEDGAEPISIYFHVLRHPTRGTFLIDTGVERAFRDSPSQAAVQGMVASAMNIDKLKVNVALGDWLQKQSVTLSGVFLTHLHIDHISGVPDLPDDTTIFAGPHETDARRFVHLFAQSTYDRQLKGKPAIRTLDFARDPSGRFEGIIDVFGDGSLWAIWSPGHTPGSMAFLVRSTNGPVLVTGDVCHTRWAWEHGVESGEYTMDHEAHAASLAKLRALVAQFPSIDVRLGHQQ